MSDESMSYKDNSRTCAALFSQDMKHLLFPKQRHQLLAILRGLRQYPKDWAFAKQHKGEPMLPIPPPALRFRVAGSYDIDSFHSSGLEIRRCFERALGTIGHSFSSFHTIFDFGVGCSRVMRWMGDIASTAKLYGSDIDSEAVQWTKRHILFADVSVNNPLPPLGYPDQFFDLIYAASVFTHLDESYQDPWLQELKRVSKPDAILLLTTHGEFAWKSFTERFAKHPLIEHCKNVYQEKGVLFFTDDGWSGIFPDFYHSMFHTKTYIMEHWSRYFEILDIIEASMLSHQDIVVCKACVF